MQKIRQKKLWPLQALITDVIYAQKPQYSLFDFNILVMFRPAILHWALRGLCVCVPGVTERLCLE